MKPDAHPRLELLGLDPGTLPSSAVSRTARPSFRECSPGYLGKLRQVGEQAARPGHASPCSINTGLRVQRPTQDQLLPRSSRRWIEDPRAPKQGAVHGARSLCPPMALELVSHRLPEIPAHQSHLAPLLDCMHLQFRTQHFTHWSRTAILKRTSDSSQAPGSGFRSNILSSPRKHTSCWTATGRPSPSPPGGDCSSPS